MKYLFFIYLLVVGCNANEGGFVGVGLTDRDIVPQSEPSPSTTLESEEVNEVLDEQANFYIESFSFGEPDPKVDYLFIIDNSSSMNQILNQVESGFLSVLNNNSFSPNSKIAVMSTMIGDDTDLFSIGLGIRGYEGIEKEPGFLDFVNKDAIQKYRDEVPSKAGQWLIDGCDSKWFSPDDVDDNGESCLSAAIQSSNTSLVAEPGIQAYEQLLIKNGNTKLFRDGAILNVIFVSDTHDPGVNNATLKARIKNFTTLEAMTRTSNKINSLKFHALAPNEVCTGEGLYDFSYFTLVDEAKGAKADPCVTNDYTDFLETMIASSKVQAPRFNLARDAKISEVFVDGVSWELFEYSEEDSSLVLEGLDPKNPVTIDVHYEAKED